MKDHFALMNWCSCNYWAATGAVFPENDKKCCSTARCLWTKAVRPGSVRSDLFSSANRALNWRVCFEGSWRHGGVDAHRTNHQFIFQIKWWKAASLHCLRPQSHLKPRSPFAPLSFLLLFHRLSSPVLFSFSLTLLPNLHFSISVSAGASAPHTASLAQGARAYLRFQDWRASFDHNPSRYLRRTALLPLQIVQQPSFILAICIKCLCEPDAEPDISQICK